MRTHKGTIVINVINNESEEPHPRFVDWWSRT